MLFSAPPAPYQYSFVDDGFHEARELSDAKRDLVASARTHRETLERMNAHLEETVAGRTAELQELLMRGHEESDGLLRQFGVRLLNGMRETGLAARLAGGEFVVVLELLTYAVDAENKARALLDRLARPYAPPGGSVQVDVSIGVVLQLPYELQDPVSLLARADQATYDAERKGQGRVALLAAELERAAS